MDNELERYILSHSDPEGDYLHRLWRATNLYTLHGRMASGHLQGRLLRMLVRMVRPRRVLEIGTFSGYSAICMAEGLEEGAKLYTFEINDEMEDFTRPWIEGSAVADKIEFIIGDAIEEAPRLGVTFDMAFIDGDKRTYTDAYEMTMGILRPGGFILADNTLWDGHVTDRAYDRDRQTQGIEAFNDRVAADPRVERVLLPTRDGLPRRKPAGQKNLAENLAVRPKSVNFAPAIVQWCNGSTTGFGSVCGGSNPPWTTGAGSIRPGFFVAPGTGRPAPPP